MINRYRCYHNYNDKDVDIIYHHDVVVVNHHCDSDDIMTKQNHCIHTTTTTIRTAVSLSPAVAVVETSTIRSHRKMMTTTMMIRLLFFVLFLIILLYQYNHYSLLSSSSMKSNSLLLVLVSSLTSSTTPLFPLILLLTKTITTTTTNVNIMTIDRMNQIFHEYHNNIIPYATAQTPIHTYDHYHHSSSRSTRRGIKSIRTTSSSRNQKTKKDNHNYFAILHASNNNNGDMPWRQYQNNNNKNTKNTQQRYGQQRGHDYRSHFIDYNTVMNDKRAQIYNVNLRSRRPNQYSWTSQIVLTTIITFILQSINPNITSKGMKISLKIRNGQELYRLITPILLHGNIFHLMTNMVSLQRVGNDVERLFGPSRYIYTYLLSGILGNIFSSYQSLNPSLGASGSVFGVVGSYFLFVNQNEWFIGEQNGNQITSSIIQTIGMNVLLGFMNPSIDQWAHAGGFIGGALVSYIAGPRLYIIDPSTIPLSSKMNNNNNMIIVDRPMIRLPTITIPKTIQKTFTKYITEPMDNILYGGGSNGQKSNNRPWLNNNQQQRQRQQRQKRNAPNQSIKPMNVDDIF